MMLMLLLVVVFVVEYRGTFVLGFADGSLETVNLKGVAFELIHNHAVCIRHVAFFFFRMSGDFLVTFSPSIR